MIINFTPQEEARIKSIEESYDKLIAETEALIEKLRPGDEGPQTDHLKPPRIEDYAKPVQYDDEERPIYRQDDLKPYNDAIRVYNAEFDAIYNAWEEEGGQEWREARAKVRELDEKKAEAIREHIRKCELRQFAELGDDQDAIYQDALYQARENLERRQTYYKQQQAKISGDGYFSDVTVRAIDGGKSFLLDVEEAIDIMSRVVSLHLEYFEKDPERKQALLDQIKQIIEASPYTSYDEGKKGGKIYRLETTGKRGYRRSADIDDRVKRYPEAYIVPTLNGYQNAVSLYQDGNAYLQPLITTDNLQFRDGKLYFKGKIEQISEVELQDLKTKQGIEEINLNLLSSYYGIILTQFYEKINKKEKLSPVIKLSIADLASCMGKRRNQTKEEIEALLKHTQSFHNIIGVEHITRNGKPDKSYWPLLNFEGYDAEENSISFSSPYINHIVETIYKQSIRRDKQGKPKLKSDGKTPLTVASHSYLIKGSIAAERNREAVQNVVIIVDIIERAGKNTPHFRIQTVIDRNPQLKQRLETSSNKVQLLKRVFTKTWELLRKQTILTEVYSNIKLPDPNDPAVIPTIKTLDEMVIEIPHDGKRR